MASNAQYDQGSGQPRPLQMGAKGAYIVRLLMVGDSSCGKTSLVLRFDQNVFSTKFVTTIGVDYRDKMVKVCMSYLPPYRMYDNNIMLFINILTQTHLLTNVLNPCGKKLSYPPLRFLFRSKNRLRVCQCVCNFGTRPDKKGSDH
jgi:hypothetical protein